MAISLFVIHLPNILIVLDSLSYPILLSALQVNMSPSIKSFVVIELALPRDESRTPLRSHIMVTGGVPVRMLQLIVTSDPPNTYTGDPILTVTSSGVTLSGKSMNGPSSMSGGSPN